MGDWNAKYKKYNMEGDSINLIEISKEQILSGEIDILLIKLRTLIEYPFMMKRFCENIDISIVGFENQSMQLWENEHVREYINRLDKDFPYWLYFLSKERDGLSIIIKCFLLPYLSEEGYRKHNLERLSNYLIKRGFPAMKHICGLAEKTEEEIEFMTNGVMAYLDDKKIISQ